MSGRLTIDDLSESLKRYLQEKGDISLEDFNGQLYKLKLYIRYSKVI